jgi:hypothetical protein
LVFKIWPNLTKNSKFSQTSPTNQYTAIMTYPLTSSAPTVGAKYKTEAWKRYQVIKTKKNEEQEEATDCNLQCPCWKEGQS